jgi:hypothetical protein
LGKEHDFFNYRVDIFNSFNCCLTKEEIQMKKHSINLIALLTANLISALQVVQAALPTAAGVTAGTTVTNTASPLVFITQLFSSGVGIGAAAVAAITVLGVAFTSYSAFVESRQKGDWKNFGVTASVGAVLVLGVVLMSIIAVDYAAV